VNHTAAWLTLAGLGAYHGVNPAMGWLFAVSRGMQERSRRAVLRSLVPIAIGHEMSIALVAALVVGLEVVTDSSTLRIVAAAVLFGFGIFRFVKPRAHFRWVRARVNRFELGWWSFLMATAHGAGLMVAPVLLGAGAADEAAASDHTLASVTEQGFSLPASGLAVLLHVGAMLAVMATMALLVYDRWGLSVLRRTWVNLDGVWAGAFVLAGILTMVT